MLLSNGAQSDAQRCRIFEATLHSFSRLDLVLIDALHSFLFVSSFFRRQRIFVAETSRVLETWNVRERTKDERWKKGTNQAWYRGVRDTLRVHKHSDGQTLTWHSGKLYTYYGTKSNFGKPQNQPTLRQFLLRKKVIPNHFQCFYPLFITWRDDVPNMRHIDAFFSLF